MNKKQIEKAIALVLLLAAALSLSGCVQVTLPELPEFAPPTPTPIVTPKPTPAPSWLPLPSDYFSPTPAVTAPVESEPPVGSAPPQSSSDCGSASAERTADKNGSSMSSGSGNGTASASTHDTPQSAAPSAARYDTPVISISGETLPGDMIQGNVCDLRGTLEASCGVITSVYAALLDAVGNPAQECSYYAGRPEFSLAGTVNASLGFSILRPGEYTYYLTAQAQNGDAVSEAVLICRDFTVKPLPGSGGSSSGSSPAQGTGSGEISFKYTDDTSICGVIWNYFVGALGNSHAAAAILANINAESSCVPIRVQGDFSSGYSVSQDYTGKVDSGEISLSGFADGSPGNGCGNGYGLCQWTYERKAALYDFARERGTSVGDLETQCAFIMHEMEDDYPRLLSYLKTAADTAEATLEFCNVYEQAGTKTGRTAMAKDFYEKYA